MADASLEICLDDFARRVSLRAANLMWFLGAGASAAAGVPTAGDMVWEFKQRLFMSQRRVSRESVADLSSPAIREQLEAHIKSAGNLPAAGSPEEYAALFEAVYPAEADRRTYLDAKMMGASPSFGHLALATLMKADLCRIVWTTNFDPLVADACAVVLGGTGRLGTVSLDAPGLASTLFADSRWPVEVKLHGDFRSRRLKNTDDELRAADADLRQQLVDSCRRYGLVVAGYSGRDDCVMDALEEAVKGKGAFPQGLFWLHRGDSAPLPRVVQLIHKARASAVEAGIVEIQNFDETMRDLVRLVDGLDATVLEQFAQDRRRWTPAPVPSGRKGWPLVRLNGLPVVESPTVCRRIVCSVGGYREIREAVDRAGVDFVFARVSSGVLAFGADSDVRKALEPHGITEFDLHTIDPRRLRNDSGERGLLRDALTRGLARERALIAVRRRAVDHFRPSDPDDGRWAELRRLVGATSGTVRGESSLRWYEGIATQLDWANDQLWVLLEPRTVFEGLTDSNRAAATDFARERSVKRYNRQLNDLVNFWAATIADGGSDVRALGIGDGVDALFRLSDKTAYSRRVQA